MLYPSVYHRHLLHIHMKKMKREEKMFNPSPLTMTVFSLSRRLLSTNRMTEMTLPYVSIIDKRNSPNPNNNNNMTSFNFFVKHTFIYS